MKVTSCCPLVEAKLPTTDTATVSRIARDFTTRSEFGSCRASTESADSSASNSIRSAAAGVCAEPRYCVGPPAIVRSKEMKATRRHVVVILRPIFIEESFHAEVRCLRFARSRAQVRSLPTRWHQRDALTAACSSLSSLPLRGRSPQQAKAVCSSRESVVGHAAAQHQRASTPTPQVRESSSVDLVARTG